MIIVDPVTLGDVACSRASPKGVFDRNGTLVQVPADTLAVTYDPSDLTKAPYALIEQAATNLVAFSEQLDNAAWTKFNYFVTPNAFKAPDGTMSADVIGPTAGTQSFSTGVPLQTIAKEAVAKKYTLRAFVAPVGVATAVRFCPFGGNTNNTASVVFDFATGQFRGDPYVSGTFSGTPTASAVWIPSCGMWLISLTFTTGVETNVVPRLFPYAGGNSFAGDGVSGLAVWGVMLAEGDPSSYTSSSRAADIIPSGAGLVYSNVPIAEATYSSSTAYAKDALVYDPATHSVFQSLIASNVGKALTDTTAWTPRGATNRWAMLDQYNNTQTTNADEILMVLSPQAISQGLYLGNLYADEARISVVDQAEGLVYSETTTLVESNSGSSFFTWAFKRIKRRDYFLTLDLPVYANALVTISLRKIGGVAKCGMCAIGPTDEFGPTLMGLSTEGKDYSSTTFNFDGTSSTIIRPYAKRMTCDVMVDNDQIDYLQARLFEIRQKPIVWVGGPYGSTAVYGRYESFKNVIQYATRSLMNLTIGGAV